MASAKQNKKTTLNPAESSPLGRFVNNLDSNVQRIGTVHLITGYNFSYSMGVGVILLVIAASFLPMNSKELPFFTSLTSFTAQVFALLMINGALFRASGGILKLRPRQGEWLIGNMKGTVHLLLNSSAWSIASVLLGLEFVAQISIAYSGPVSVCIVLLLWMALLIFRERMKRY